MSQALRSESAAFATRLRHLTDVLSTAATPLPSPLLSSNQGFNSPTPDYEGAAEEDDHTFVYDDLPPELLPHLDNLRHS